MGKQNVPEQDATTLIKSASILLPQQQQQQQQPLEQQQRHPSISETKTSSSPITAEPLYTKPPSQTTESSSFSKPTLPLLKTSPVSDNKETSQVSIDTTTTTAIAGAALSLPSSSSSSSSSTDMEGIMEEEIAMLQIKQTPSAVDNNFLPNLFDDSLLPSPERTISTPRTSTAPASSLTFEVQASLPNECNLTLSHTPQSVEQQGQGQCEPMDVDVIMTDETERILSKLSASEEEHVIPPAGDPTIDGHDEREVKGNKELTRTDGSSVSDSDDDQENNDEDDEDDEDDDEDEDDDDDDEEGVSDKGKARASSSSSSSHFLPREPVLIAFEDAVYSAVPVSSELYIIPYCSKGFSWNADLFLKPHQRRSLGLDDLYRTLGTEARGGCHSSSTSTSSTSDIDGIRNQTVDSNNSSSSHGPAIHVHEILLNDLDTATIIPYQLAPM